MDTITLGLSGFADNTGVQEMVHTLTNNSSSIWNNLQTESLFAFPNLGSNWGFVLTLLCWLLIIIWIIKDSNYRSFHTGFIILSVLLVSFLTPFIGLPIYRAIRPKGYKYERAYRKTIMTDGFEEEYEDDQQAVKFDITPLDTVDSDEIHLASLKQSTAKKPTAKIDQTIQSSGAIPKAKKAKRRK